MALSQQGDRSPKSPRRGSIARRTGSGGSFFFEGFVKGGKEIPHFWEKIWKENNWKIKIIDDLEMAPPVFPFWELKPCLLGVYWLGSCR